MPDVFHIDFESYSEADLKRVGSYKYASHPSTRVTLLAIAKNDGPVGLWDHSDQHSDEAVYAQDLLHELSHGDGLVVCHNVGFEAPMWQYVLDKEKFPMPAFDRWRCTAAMCRRAAIPWNLKDAAIFLKLDAQKVDAGKTLIRYLCVPQKEEHSHYTVNGVKLTHDDAWALFAKYCIQDVEVERQIFHRLKKSFSLDNEPGFFFDLTLNARGIPINRAALLHANAVVGSAMERLTAEFVAITGLKPTQRDKVLHWMRARGYPFEDLQAAHMEEALEEPMWESTPEAFRALEIRAGVTFAALAKIPTMLDMACEDDRIRGAFLWSGALRTHRWSGMKIQPQNFKRPTIKDTHLAYECIKKGWGEEALEMVFGPVPEVLASCIRHFIESPGQQFLDADYANIEARITPWLCGQEDMLDEFRRGEDVYKKMACTIFGITESRVTGDQRFIAKQATLACQFQVGWKKFKSTCQKFGHTVDAEICKLAVEKYREKRDKIKAAWWQLNAAAMAAIREGGKHSTCRVSFRYGAIAGFRALQMTLPSGHKLIYPSAKIEKVMKDFGTGDGPQPHEEIQFYGKKPFSSLWGWQSTYGGKLLENATQAVGGDFMTHGLVSAAAAGYDCFATIHDQALCVKEDHHNVEQFRSLLCDLPSWAQGFPLEASCGLMPFYSKD